MMNEDCCEQASGVSRRGFLKLSSIAGMAGVSTSLIGDTFVQTAYGASTDTHALVILSLRGGIDGMSVVVPHGEKAYYDARPNISINKDKLFATDSMFGLHPNLSSLKNLWDNKELAVVNAVGMLTPNRSHFSAMEEIEDADPGSSARIGWLNRLIGMGDDSSPLAGIQYGQSAINTQLVGPAAALATVDPARVKFPATTGREGLLRKAGLDIQYANNNSAIGKAYRSAVKSQVKYAPVLDNMKQTSVNYPKTDIGKALQATAATIKAQVGAQVITVDHGSWDHHIWMGDLNDGHQKRRTIELADALAAFYKDLGSMKTKCTLVTISEFGRRLEQNTNAGLDHGWGNFMFVVDSNANGGRYHTDWPGLTLGVDSDLRATTDYRTVLGEIIVKRFPHVSLSKVFPGYSYTPLNILR